MIFKNYIKNGNQITVRVEYGRFTYIILVRNSNVHDIRNKYVVHMDAWNCPRRTSLVQTFLYTALKIIFTFDG